MTPERPSLQPGDLAPSFRLPAVNRDGMVSLEDYHGRSPVLVGLFRGLHCPFCRLELLLRCPQLHEAQVWRRLRSSTRP